MVLLEQEKLLLQGKLQKLFMLINLRSSMDLKYLVNL